VLRPCRDAFSGFVSEVGALLTAGQRAELEALTIVPADCSTHTCVTVFHEHPSLLKDDSQRQAWRPIESGVRIQLTEALKCMHIVCERPLLELDALLLTADGAMIAGFVDRKPGAFEKLRSSSAAIGEQ